MPDITAKLLQSAGLKNTQARRDVLKVLSDATIPLSVEQILETLHMGQKKTDRVTVYRTVNTLCDANILSRIEFGEGRARFELSTLPHHHHLICQSCGNVSDVEVCLEDSKIRQLEKDASFHVSHHSLDFYGTCDKCARYPLS
jgi:Fur family ferric uptake transcriptional regulator